ncbi:MAG TPA: DUF3857 domain-containing protein, partial [Thermoanaerobaculia bacterium]
ETKLTSLSGWTVTASGQEFQIGRRDAVESSAYDSNLYSDSKLTFLSVPAAEPGNVVAFEYEQRDRPYSLQDVWELHRGVPVRLARYTLVMPDGWSQEAKWFNSEPVAPQSAGNTTRWEVRDLPEIKDEPRMPSPRSIGARVGINFIPPEERERLAGKSHRTWDDVAKTYTSLIATQGGATPALQAKARELMAGKETTLAKIAALAAFAQKDVRYVAIEIGIGGLQPHAAGDVLANRYGDCKDKVTVLAAMLREAGVESHYVLANVYRGWVDPSFATLSAFNHAIIAIRLPRDVDTKGMQAVVEHPTAGKLLLFDPTSETTPFGALPYYLQDNHVLVVDGAKGHLVTVKPHAPEASQMSLSAKLKLDANGALSGEVTEVRRGAMAGWMRQTLAPLDEAARKQFYDRRVANHLTGATTVSGLTVENADDSSKDLVVRYTIQSAAYAKRTGGMLLVRPRVLGTKVETVLDLKDRKYGYETDGPSLEIDEIEIALPFGTTVAELPPPANVVTPVLRYKSEAKADGSKLSYRREYRVDGLMVSLEALPELNKAFAAIVKDEKNSAILKE